jgi:hypothetical protein
MSEPMAKNTKTNQPAQGWSLPAIMWEETDEWNRLCAPWRSELEASARASKALQRKRKIRSAPDLLRLALGYSLNDWSLQQLGAWATAMEVSATSMSNTAIQERLRQSRPWLSLLVGQLLQPVQAPAASTGVQVRLIDATVICQPGSTGTDWRVHLSWNAGTLCLEGIELTDAHGGETLARHAADTQAIGIGDRGYGHRPGLGVWLAHGAQVVVRTNGHNLPLETGVDEKLDLSHWLQTVPSSSQLCARRVWVSTPSGRFGLRLIARRLPPAAAAAALRRLNKTSRKKGRTPNALSQLLTGWVLLVTNLPDGLWPDEAVLGLYRLRWQVELVIKRAKSLVQLDHVRAQDPDMVQVYLLGKIISLLLLDNWTRQQVAQLAEWFADTTRSLSLWRWTALWADQLRAIVRGPFTLKIFLAALPKLQRYLHDRPRQRQQQLAHARHLIQSLGFNSFDTSIPSALVAVPA